MKRKCILLITLLASYFANSQIQIQRVKTIEKRDTLITYNDNNNIEYQKNLDDYKQYIGLDVLFLPFNPNHFRYQKRVDDSISNCFYKLNADGFLISKIMKHDDIEGKTFKIIDFHIEESKSEVTNIISKHGCFILLDIDDKQFHLYKIPFDKKFNSIWPSYSPYDNNQPFITIPYLKKFKEKFQNEYFIFKDQFYLDYKYNFVDINNGVNVEVNPLDSFKCIDLRIMDAEKDIYFMQPYLIFQNNDNNQIRVSFVKNIAERDYNKFNPTIIDIEKEYNRDSDFYLLSDIQAKEQEEIRKKLENDLEEKERKQECIRLFGNYYGKLIGDRKVQTGMSKNMCEYAWGKPSSINTSTGSYGVHEQWVYGDNSYLYFENGKLTDIQN